MERTTRVLCVEDDLQLRTFIRLRLELESVFSVTECESTEEVVENTGTADFDVYLVDQNLPGCSGLQFLASLDPAQRARAILCSGDLNAGLERDARELGIGGLIFKPLLGRELVAAAHSVLAGDTWPPGTSASNGSVPRHSRQSRTPCLANSNNPTLVPQLDICDTPTARPLS